MSVGCSGKKKETTGTNDESAGLSTHIQTSDIIKAKLEEWGIEPIVTSYGIYVDWNSNGDYFYLTYVYHVTADSAKEAFEESLYGRPNSAYRLIHDWYDKKEKLNEEPRRQILSGYSWDRPDLWVLVQTGQQYFFLYGCGEEQENRVRDLAQALDLDIT